MKRCSKKECCKQCKHVKSKGTVTNWPVQKPTNRTLQKHVEHHDATDIWFRKNFFCVFGIFFFSFLFIIFQVDVAQVAQPVVNTATVCWSLNVSDCVLSHVTFTWKQQRLKLNNPFSLHVIIPAVLFSPSILEVPLTCNLFANRQRFSSGLRCALEIIQRSNRSGVCVKRQAPNLTEAVENVFE